MNEPGPYVRHVPTMGKEKPQSPSTMPYVRHTPKYVMEKPEPFAPIVEMGTIEGFGKWTLDEDGLLVISGNGRMPDWEYSKETKNTTAPWWRNQEAIKQIRIAMGVTNIGERAFYHCTSLTSITIPNSVTSIGRSAFEKCTSLTSITIPNSVTSIGWWAFDGCTSLTSITIPDSVTSIGCCAFFGCTRLASITIPNSVTDLEEGAFENCENLKKVVMPYKFKHFIYESIWGGYKLFRGYYGIPKDIVTFT